MNTNKMPRKIWPHHAKELKKNKYIIPAGKEQTVAMHTIVADIVLTIFIAMLVWISSLSLAIKQEIPKKVIKIAIIQ